MTIHRKSKVILLAATLLLALPVTVAASAPSGERFQQVNDKIDPFILEQIAANGQANIFIKMASDASLLEAERIADRVDRLNYVYRILLAHSNSSQRVIRLVLRVRGFSFQPFWINNSIYVYNADLALVQALAERQDVAYLRGDREVPLIAPVEQQGSEGRTDAVEWNILKINADEAWASGVLGDGIVVANIDTGVRYTHEALVDSYRGNNGDGTFNHDYNWFDPVMSLGAPADSVGHGTHTMGTMVGGDGPGSFSEDIGVAPNAKWIAAKGCGVLFCSEFRLIASAQWVACPTKVDGTMPDCSKAPHVVNNSWGGGQGNDWYVSYVRSWLSAGIAPVFSIGNSGPSCDSAGSPGDYNLVAGVGATDSNDVLASFSSRGRGGFRIIKPDFVAPGQSVRSSVGSGDNAYAFYSGTSMAAPHVAGTVALMLSAEPNAGLVQIYNALRLTTVQGLSAPPGSAVCGGRSYDVYPNEIYGWGRIDAAAAVGAIAP